MIFEKTKSIFFELTPSRDITAYELALIMRLGGNKFIECSDKTMVDKFRTEIKSANLEQYFTEISETEFRNKL